MGKLKSTESTARKKLFFLVLLFTLTAQVSHATHLAATEISYSFISADQYRVTYILYRDCSGTLPPLSVNLSVKSTDCNAFYFYSLQRENATGVEISSGCSTATTTCNGGTVPGIQKWTYSSVISIPLQCSDWKLSVSDCCRNAAITTLDNPSAQAIYTEARLNNLLQPNNSPTFNSNPILYLSKGQDNHLSFGGLETDGDSLVYIITDPLTGEDSPVSYSTGYSAVQPIHSLPLLSLDASSGELTIHPTQQEIGVMEVVVKEYRNGVFAGSVVRDMQLIVQNISNALPTLSGINNLSSNSVHTCAGSTLQFNILSSDADIGQQLTMTIISKPTALGFSVNNVQAPTGNFTWNTSLSDERIEPYHLIVKVWDNACPSNGVQYYTYDIYVDKAMTAAIQTVNPMCLNSTNGNVAVSVTNGHAPFLYHWSASTVQSNVLQNVGVGPYSFTVTDQAGCQISRTVVLSATDQLSVTIHQLTPATCENGSDGMISANATNGITPFTFQWSDGTLGSNLASIPPGNYDLIVTDSLGCASTVSAVLSYRFTSPVLRLEPTITACSGDVVTLFPGSNTYSYLWSDGSTDAIKAVTESGNYEVTAVDQNGCSAVAKTTIEMHDCEQPKTIVVSNSGFQTFLELSGFSETIDLTMYSASGQLVYKQESTQMGNTKHHFLIDGLARGLYIFRIATDTGEWTRKFIR